MDARWRPTEGRYIAVDRIEVGMILAVDHSDWRHHPWRVHEIREREDGRRIYFRPPGDLYDLAEHNRPATVRKHASVYRLPDHYALCHLCGQLPPCSEVWTEKISTADAERNARYEVEGFCPSCQKPVTHRQESHRFDENLYVPLGPPVVFHGRQACVGGAIAYDEALAKKNDTEPRLSCGGHVTQHSNGDRECTNTSCPGDRLRHRSFSMCYVAGRCNRPECWALAQTRADARREGQR
ncbi:hypothetical protein MOX01_22590 [Microbacterium oxydans]|uniref:hypothetical protein n=1 Tax=Microbacterium oxydans TaxID=82380 RepID=UPI00116B4B98|nr:hypothetical protein MOX01_22590 [Microbacterium oxydans]